MSNGLTWYIFIASYMVIVNHRPYFFSVFVHCPAVAPGICRSQIKLENRYSHKGYTEPMWFKYQLSESCFILDSTAPNQLIIFNRGWTQCKTEEEENVSFFSFEKS